jgi:hypothetical protein
MNPETRSALPKMAFVGFAARYREPALTEGFQDITQVDFQVNIGTTSIFELYPFVWIKANRGTNQSLMERKSKRSFGKNSGYEC